MVVEDDGVTLYLYRRQHRRGQFVVVVYSIAPGGRRRCRNTTASLHLYVFVTGDTSYQKDTRFSICEPLLKAKISCADLRMRNTPLSNIRYRLQFEIIKFRRVDLKSGRVWLVCLKMATLVYFLFTWKGHRVLSEMVHST